MSGFLQNLQGVVAWPSDFLWGGKKNGPITGNEFTGDDQKAVTDAMQNVEDQYAAYRPDMAQSRMNALDQTLSLFQPANQELGNLYGQGAMAPLQQVGSTSPATGTVGTGKIAGVK